MAYKDKKQQKSAVARAVHKHRTGITLLTRPNGHDYDPDERLSDGRKRYLGPLSDGQVLDRMTLPNKQTDNVGSESGQHPFNGMESTIFKSKTRV